MKKLILLVFLRLMQLLTKWGIVILAILLGLSGLTYYMWFAEIFGDFFLFSWHIDYDILLLIFIVIHVGVGFKFFLTRKRIKHWGYDISIGLLILSLTITVISINYPQSLAQMQSKSEVLGIVLILLKLTLLDLIFFKTSLFPYLIFFVHLNSIGENQSHLSL